MMLATNKNIHAICFTTLIVLVQSIAINAQNRIGSYPLWEKDEKLLDSVLATLSNDFNKTCYLRRYVSGLCAIGNRPNYYCDNYTLTENSVNTLFPLYYEILKTNKGTAKCGLASYMLNELYRRKGVTSCTYNVGISGTKNTHEFVLVKIKHGNDSLAIIQDPHFNLTITNEKNQPIDFTQYLRCLKKRKGAFLKMKLDTINSHIIVSDKNYREQVNEKRNLILKSSDSSQVKYDDSYAIIPFVKHYESIRKMEKIGQLVNWEDVCRSLKLPAFFTSIYGLPLINNQNACEWIIKGNTSGKKFR